MTEKRKVRIGRLTTVGQVAAELGRLYLRLDAEMCRSPMQVASRLSLRLCASVLKPVSLSGGSNKWKLHLLLRQTRSCHFGEQ